jgi:hypothetical protein
MRYVAFFLILTGVSHGYLQADYAFYSGSLYLRQNSMYPFPAEGGRDPYTLIPVITDDCRTRPGRESDINRWNAAMLRLWEQVNQPETHFTVRAGEEYLVYENYMLLYISGNTRTSIQINPEELWTILSQCRRPVSPSLAQVSMEGWFPGLDSPVTSFVTAGPVMDVIQLLFERGRNSTGQE